MASPFSHVIRREGKEITGEPATPLIVQALAQNLGSLLAVHGAERRVENGFEALKMPSSVPEFNLLESE